MEFIKTAFKIFIAAGFALAAGVAWFPFYFSYQLFITPENFGHFVFLPVLLSLVLILIYVRIFKINP